MRLSLGLILSLVSLGCTAQPMLTPLFVLPIASEQLVVVTTEDWEASSGMLQRFERVAGAWEPVSDLIPVVVGRNGLGWGSGLNPEQASGPRKQEGDGRAPAGVFSLTNAFGYAETLPTRLPYIHSTANTECVDDSGSQFYNRVLDRNDVQVDWTSHEEMRRSDELYRIGVEVAHNEEAVPRGGSCIFLHIWRGPDSTTSGCTAMAASEMEHTAAWLDADKSPILVQLPQSEYERLRVTWRLP